MNEQNDIKRSIIAIGRLLWEKDLTTGLGGNLSRRIDEDSFFITAAQTCLGLLKESDIVAINGQDDAEGSSTPSSEWRLHRAIYHGFPDCQAIVHIHPVHTNGFFLKNKRLEPKILEAKHVLGEVPAVDQYALNVEDCDAVVDALKTNTLVVLRNHGCLAVGKDLFECFVKLQTLEEAVKTEIICKLYS